MKTLKVIPLILVLMTLFALAGGTSSQASVQSLSGKVSRVRVCDGEEILPIIKHIRSEKDWIQTRITLRSEANRKAAIRRLQKLLRYLSANIRTFRKNDCVVQLRIGGEETTFSGYLVSEHTYLKSILRRVRNQ